MYLNQSKATGLDLVKIVNPNTGISRQVRVVKKYTSSRKKEPLPNFRISLSKDRHTSMIAPGMYHSRETQNTVISISRIRIMLVQLCRP